MSKPRKKKELAVVFVYSKDFMERVIRNLINDPSYCKSCGLYCESCKYNVYSFVRNVRAAIRGGKRHASSPTPSKTLWRPQTRFFHSIFQHPASSRARGRRRERCARPCPHGARDRRDGARPAQRRGPGACRVLRLSLSPCVPRPGGCGRGRAPLGAPGMAGRIFVSKQTLTLRVRH